MSFPRRGYTLLEMSLVVVIIAMLMGAIVFGNVLIRNAEIQNINGEMEGHLTAIKTFQDKYQALPGDYSNASNIFSGAFNGNGNGIVAGSEEFYGWHQLSLAKLIEGKFYPPGSSEGWLSMMIPYPIPGYNIPTSQIATAGWGYVYAASNSVDLLYVSGDTPPGHVLWFGGYGFNAGDDHKLMPVLTPEEADQIDLKFDDGLPGTGKIVSQVNNNGAECYASTSAYRLSTTDKVCALIFKTGF